MTPEQIAEAVMSKWYAGPTLAKHVDLVDLIAPAIRAALRERDAAWAAAVKASGLMLAPDSDNEAWKPLRALLEEAGSNGKEES